MACNGDVLLMSGLLALLINSSCKGAFCRKRHIIKKKPKMSPFTTCSNTRTPFAHHELIWVLSLCKYSTNCPRPSETIYSYHKAWEPSVPNGVICIVNGNALLVCSIWLCTGALMGAWWTISVSRSSHAAPRWISEGPRLPLVAEIRRARPETDAKTVHLKHRLESRLW